VSHQLLVQPASAACCYHVAAVMRAIDAAGRALHVGQVLRVIASASRGLSDTHAIRRTNRLLSATTDAETIDEWGWPRRGCCCCCGWTYKTHRPVRPVGQSVRQSWRCEISTGCTEWVEMGKWWNCLIWTSLTTVYYTLDFIFIT